MIKNNIQEAGAVQMNVPQVPQRKSPNGFMRNRGNSLDYFNHSTKRRLVNTNPNGPQYYYGENAERNFKTDFLPLYNKVTESQQNLQDLLSADLRGIVGGLVDNLPNGGTVQYRQIFRFLNSAKRDILKSFKALDSAKNKYKQALEVLGVNSANQEDNHYDYYHIKESVHNGLIKLLQEQQEKGDE